MSYLGDMRIYRLWKIVVVCECIKYKGGGNMWRGWKQQGGSVVEECGGDVEDTLWWRIVL